MDLPYRCEGSFEVEHGLGRHKSGIIGAVGWLCSVLTATYLGTKP